MSNRSIYDLTAYDMSSDMDSSDDIEMPTVCPSNETAHDECVPDCVQAGPDCVQAGPVAEEWYIPNDRNKWLSLFKSQPDKSGCLDVFPHREYKHYIRRGADNKFTAFKRTEDLEGYLLTAFDLDRCIFNEVIYSEEPMTAQRLRLDVDLKGEDIWYDFTTFLNYIIMQARIVIMDCFKGGLKQFDTVEEQWDYLTEVIPDTDYTVFDMSGSTKSNYKHSAHIIFKYYGNAEHSNLFTKQLKKMLTAKSMTKHAEAIDMAVSNLGVSNLRTPYSSKWDEIVAGNPRVKMPTGSLEDSMVVMTIPRGNNYDPKYDLLSTVIERPAQQAIEQPNDEISKIISDACTGGLLNELIYSGVMCDDGYKITRVGKGYCRVCKRDHTKVGGILKISEYKNTIKYNYLCWRASTYVDEPKDRYLTIYKQTRKPAMSDMTPEQFIDYIEGLSREDKISALTKYIGNAKPQVQSDETDPKKKFLNPRDPYCFTDYELNNPDQGSSIGPLLTHIKSTVGTWMDDRGTSWFMVKSRNHEGEVHYRIKNEILPQKTHSNFYYTITVGEDGIEKKSGHGLNRILSHCVNTITYDNIVFEPYGRDKPVPYGNTLNLFTGFKIDFYDGPAGDCTAWLHHAENIICSGDKKLLDYVISWFARLVQYPNHKDGTALVLCSKEQGSGKNCFVDPISQHLLGQEYCTMINDSNKLAGDFNGWLEKSLLLVSDEAVFCGDKKTFSTLKNLITQTEMTYNQKYKPMWTGKNYTRLVFCSNEDQPVYIEKHDRRYTVIQVSPAVVGNSEYFENYRKQMNDKANIKALYEFLMNYNITQDMTRAYETEYKESVKNMTVDEFTNLIDCVRTREITTGFHVDDGYAYLTYEYVRTAVQGRGKPASARAIKKKFADIGIDQIDKKIDGIKFRCYPVWLE